MGQQRRRISAEKKVEIIREHLDNKKTVSELAEGYGIHPNIIMRWKKEFFEGAVRTCSVKHGTSEKKNFDLFLSRTFIDCPMNKLF